MNDQKDGVPRRFNGNGLTEDERKWLRQRVKVAEHRQWLWSTARKIGIVFGAMVAGFGSTLGTILALKEFIKWIGGGK